MSVGKRLSTDEPLTEHDVAARLDAALMRVWRIAHDARVNQGPEFYEAVRNSRYLTNAITEVERELAYWHERNPHRRECRWGEAECGPTCDGYDPERVVSATTQPTDRSNT